MKQPSTRGRRSLATMLAMGMVASAVTLTGTTAAYAEPAQPTEPPKETPVETLGSHDAELLAEAEAAGKRAVTLIIATDKGEAGDVAADITRLGGSVTRRFDKAGYVLARVPTGKVLQAARGAGIAAVDLDEQIKLPDPEVEANSTKVAQQAAPAAPGADTPAVNPFMPTHETGAVAFKQSNPAYDGRGITIGIMDSGVDLDHPALQKTTTGERKIVDWVTATDPVTDQDGTWLRMNAAVTGPAFTFGGQSWTAPAGTWRVSAFLERITNDSEPAGDVNRDGDKTDFFGVLYDPVTHDIRVDANQDRDFTNDPVMRPYRERFDIGHFGADRTDTPVRDQMPFVVEYREDVDLTPDDGVAGPFEDYVNIGIVEDAHGSHVAGITAANDLFGNAALDGAAPGAKLVSSRACLWGGSCSAAALTTGMTDLVVNRKVDVVNMSIGGLPALNDGNNARAEIYNNLIDVYGVQLFISAGNSGPGVNTVGDPSVVSNVVSVAASISRQTWLSNYGSVVRNPNALFNFSSRGPREDGGFKPNITAPGSAISTVPLWQAGTPVPEAGYPLPPGYAMFNGTSMSSPQAAGAAALLLSAARANDLGITPAALRRAIYSSANWIAGVPAHGQGYGMFDVPGAWDLLKEPIETRSYTSDAPVCTLISGFLEPANRGTGVYNRCEPAKGGHRAGQSKSYQVKITRTSGPARTVTHRLSWLGNDGTFSAPASVALPLNRTVNVAVNARPAAGVHSAILRVDDPATSVVDFEVLNTVIAADVPVKPNYSFSTEGSVDRNGFTSFFVTVPDGAASLQVNLSGIATGSHTRFIAINPYGVPVESTSSLECYTNFSNAATCKPQERDYRNPLPGVWEIEVESRRTSPSLNNPFRLTARIQGAAVSPDVVTLPSVTVGQPTPVSWTVTNNFGPVRVTGQGAPLGSAAISRPTIANGAQQTYTVEVPEGASRLDVAIGNPSDPAADLDLTVYRGETQVGQSADGDSEEAVSLVNPPAGTYRVVVDGYAVPAGTTAYDYRDVFFSPALGAVVVPTRFVALANGASTTISGQVVVRAAPPAGRQMFGEMSVVTDEGAVIGTGAVRITSVS